MFCWSQWKRNEEKFDWRKRSFSRVSWSMYIYHMQDTVELSWSKLDKTKRVRQYCVAKHVQRQIVRTHNIVLTRSFCNLHAFLNSRQLTTGPLPSPVGLFNAGWASQSPIRFRTLGSLWRSCDINRYAVITSSGCIVNNYSVYRPFNRVHCFWLYSLDTWINCPCFAD